MNDVIASDTTLFKFNNKFWLFTHLRKNNNSPSNEELYLFFSDSLYGEWTSHPLNPIMSDVRNSRPAGSIIRWNDKIIRAAQDCSIRYGYGIKLNEITEITEKEYKEVFFQDILPNWKKEIYGVHTINSDKDITVIDCLIKRRKFF